MRTIMYLKLFVGEYRESLHTTIDRRRDQFVENSSRNRQLRQL